MKQYLDLIQNILDNGVEKESGRENMPNLKLYKIIGFKDLVKHGLENGANVVNGMPWSWKINGKVVTHERDDCYLIETIEGQKRFEPGDQLWAQESGIKYFPFICYDTHAPGGCPM